MGTDDPMNMIRILNGMVVSAEGSHNEDLILENGTITACGDVSPRTYPGSQVIDATGKLVFPGGFDPHVHLALPTPAGSSCDDFRSGSVAALAGGTTFYMDFVTPRRGQSLHEALKFRRVEARESVTGCGFHMGISEWNSSVSGEIVPLIVNEGIRSFKAYLAYRETIGISLTDLQELMQIAGPAGAVVMVHCEDGEMVSRLQQEYLHRGLTRPCFHAVTRPPEAELRAVSGVIELAAKTGCPAYIVHISTHAGAEAVASAKRSGIRVYGETCPQYLLLDESVYDPGRNDLDVLRYILSPPIRGKKDQEGLWEALADGMLDVVATDHCPFNLHGQKDAGIRDFTKIPNGAGGIEHRLGLLYTHGVLGGRITLNRFVELVSTRPAEIFRYGQKKGKLLPGYDADIVIWDPDATSVISAATHHSRCDNEIYEGFRVQGRPETMILSGKIVTRNT